MSELLITTDDLGHLAGKVAIVTGRCASTMIDLQQLPCSWTITLGGASGIGKAIVELLAQHGAIVPFGDINEDVSRTLEDSINSAGQYVACELHIRPILRTKFGIKKGRVLPRQRH